jgi:1-acyl-sn-glycerol-3-phosphate acyltransferase
MSFGLSDPAYYALRWPLGMFMVLAYGFRFERRRELPRHGPLLIIANHQSFFDIIVFGLACPRRIFFLARHTLANNPILGWIMRQFGTVLIDQDGLGRAGLVGIETALKEGKAVLVFPEGERCWDGKLHDLKPGITLLIKRVEGLSVVAAGVAGAFSVWPRFQRLPHLAPVLWAPKEKKIAVCMGAAFPAGRLTTKPREEQIRIMHEEMEIVFKRAEEMRCA